MCFNWISNCFNLLCEPVSVNCKYRFELVMPVYPGSVYINLYVICIMSCVYTLININKTCISVFIQLDSNNLKQNIKLIELITVLVLFENML